MAGQLRPNCNRFKTLLQGLSIKELQATEKYLKSQDPEQVKQLAKFCSWGERVTQFQNLNHIITAQDDELQPIMAQIAEAFILNDSEVPELFQESKGLFTKEALTVFANFDPDQPSQAPDYGPYRLLLDNLVDQKFVDGHQDGQSLDQQHLAVLAIKHFLTPSFYPTDEQLQYFYPQWKKLVRKFKTQLPIDGAFIVATIQRKHMAKGKLSDQEKNVLFTNAKGDQLHTINILIKLVDPQAVGLKGQKQKLWSSRQDKRELYTMIRTKIDPKVILHGLFKHSDLLTSIQSFAYSQRARNMLANMISQEIVNGDAKKKYKEYLQLGPFQFVLDSAEVLAADKETETLDDKFDDHGIATFAGTHKARQCVFTSDYTCQKEDLQQFNDEKDFQPTLLIKKLPPKTRSSLQKSPYRKPALAPFAFETFDYQVEESTLIDLIDDNNTNQIITMVNMVLGNMAFGSNFDLVLSQWLADKSENLVVAHIEDINNRNRGMFKWKDTDNFAIPVVIPARHGLSENELVMVDFKYSGRLYPDTIQQLHEDTELLRNFKANQYVLTKKAILHIHSHTGVKGLPPSMNFAVKLVLRKGISDDTLVEPSLALFVNGEWQEHMQGQDIIKFFARWAISFTFYCPYIRTSGNNTIQVQHWLREYALNPPVNKIFFQRALLLNYPSIWQSLLRLNGRLNNAMQYQVVYAKSKVPIEVIQLDSQLLNFSPPQRESNEQVDVENQSQRTENDQDQHSEQRSRREESESSEELSDSDDARERMEKKIIAAKREHKLKQKKRKELKAIKLQQTLQFKAKQQADLIKRKDKEQDRAIKNKGFSPEEMSQLLAVQAKTLDEQRAICRMQKNQLSQLRKKQMQQNQRQQEQLREPDPSSMIGYSFDKNQKDQLQLVAYQKQEQSKRQQQQQSDRLKKSKSDKKEAEFSFGYGPSNTGQERRKSQLRERNYFDNNRYSKQKKNSDNESNNDEDQTMKDMSFNQKPKPEQEKKQKVIHPQIQMPCPKISIPEEHKKKTTFEHEKQVSQKDEDQQEQTRPDIDEAQTNQTQEKTSCLSQQLELEDGTNEIRKEHKAKMMSDYDAPRTKMSKYFEGCNTNEEILEHTAFSNFIAMVKQATSIDDVRNLIKSTAKVGRVLKALYPVRFTEVKANKDNSHELRMFLEKFEEQHTKFLQNLDKFSEHFWMQEVLYAITKGEKQLCDMGAYESNMI